MGQKESQTRRVGRFPLAQHLNKNLANTRHATEDQRKQNLFSSVRPAAFIHADTAPNRKRQKSEKRDVAKPDHAGYPASRSSKSAASCVGCRLALGLAGATQRSLFLVKPRQAGQESNRCGNIS